MKGQITRFTGSWGNTDYPVETEGKLYAVKMLSNNDGWLVGEKGIIARWNGTTWTQIAASPTANDLRAVDLRTASDGWAVGEDGAILRWNGTAWTQVNSPTILDLYGVVSVSATDAWAVGEFGIILRWDGVRWNIVFGPTVRKLEDISIVPGTNGSDIWAVGSSNKTMHWNGSDWGPVQGPASSYYAVGMASANDGWAPAAGARFYRWDGSTWALAGTWLSAYELVMLSANNGWAVGWNGKIQHWNGTSWSSVTSPTATMLQAISAVGPNELWAVGYNGTVVRYNGTAWSIVNTPDTTGLNDVSMVSSSDGWAVGYAHYADFKTDSPFLRWNGTSWTRPLYSQVSKTLYGVSLVQTPSGATGWAVGEAGEVYQLKNGTWTAGCTYTSNNLFGIAMASRYEAWAVGDGGVILHWLDPNRPATIPTVTTSGISAITSNSASGGGNVTSDGKSPVTSRGICWATSPNPTKADTCAAGGSGTGTFTGNITGLNPGTIYNVRAYATNAVGTAYGSNTSFTTGLPNRIYVDSAGICGGRAPCYNKVQNGMGAAGEGSTVLVMQGSYPESVTISESFKMDCGYNSDYSSLVSSSEIAHLTLSGGPLTVGGQLSIGGSAAMAGIAGSQINAELGPVETNGSPSIQKSRPVFKPRLGSPEKDLLNLLMTRFSSRAEKDYPASFPDEREALKRLTLHLYLTALGRAPEQWGMNLWIDSYLSYYMYLGIGLGQAAAQMGRMIFLSAEYGQRGRTDSEFLRDCADAFRLGVEYQENAEWTTGLTREQVVTIASSSEQFSNWVSTMLPGFPGEQTRNFVSHLYAGLLDRLPWEAEIEYWVSLVEARGPEDVSMLMGNTLTASHEFKNAFPSYPEQVERLFRAFAGRFASTDETVYWTLLLESGEAAIADIVEGFAEGEDFSK